MRQRAERQQNASVFCVPILLSRSDALAVSSVTQADDRCLEAQLYEKSYPIPMKKALPPCQKRAREPRGTVFKACCGEEKMRENHTRGCDFS